MCPSVSMPHYDYMRVCLWTNYVSGLNHFIIIIIIINLWTVVAFCGNAQLPFYGVLITHTV